MASASTWRRSSPAMPPAIRCRIRRCCGTSSPTRLWPARSSSPRPGTPPDCTRSAASSATPGRNGTADSATMSATSSAANPGSRAARRGSDGRQPRDLWPQAARGRAERQLRDLPRRLHAQRSRFLQPTSTTRPTAKTTATAPTTTAVGTAASKGRPTIRRSRSCATAR